MVINMKKIFLVDGNNLLFRSYYATAYSGNLMKNSKGFPTNAIYGLASMINKILTEEKVEYILVAFDKGKTFRHDKYTDYKAGRISTPDDLKMQMPLSRKLLDAMGVKHFEIDNYEADDIIGTLSKIVTNEEELTGVIISSDKDLLQLINNKVVVKSLKTKDYILYDEKEFMNSYGIEPIKIIDLKALMGDSSDNIPGVKGIGEKTAIKLLQDYGSLDGVYENIDKLTPKLREKLINDKENAYMSKDLATIYKDVPLDLTIEDLKYSGPNSNELKELYEELEFYSLLKNIQNNVNKKETKYTVIDNIDNLNINEDCAIYLELDNKNYHKANIVGMSVCTKDNLYYLTKEVIEKKPNFLENNKIYTYDIKRAVVALNKEGIKPNFVFDTLIAGNLLNYNVKDDIAYLANQFSHEIIFEENLKKSTDEEQLQNSILKAKFIYETYDELNKKIYVEGARELFNNIEIPLTYVLADMEINGIKVDVNVLKNMEEEISIKLELIAKDIYNYAGEEFNIASPKQLGTILYDKLKIQNNKKGKNANSTSKEVLEQLKDKHPIIEKILEYRILYKLYTTYIVGLKDYVLEDGKIHTIYTQTLTRTGRLSSTEPNLQNIPIRYEYGKLIRKAFLPSENNLLISSDYSQIELRIFAHMSKENNLIEAFVKDMDIHTKTAMDIFKLPEGMITSEMRRQAKAVNFGILYGISSFGLAEDLQINPKDAKKFIDIYMESFPGIKKYMDETIKNAHETSYVTTIMNRKRVIDELNNSNYLIRSQGERMALNTPIQGSSADIIKKAMIDIHNRFKEENLKSKMILQIHDELVFDVALNEKDKVVNIIRDLMENVYKLDVPLKVDINEGKNWYEAK